jgi:hypothetical protein
MIASLRAVAISAPLAIVGCGLTLVILTFLVVEPMRPQRDTSGQRRLVHIAVAPSLGLLMFLIVLRFAVLAT